MTEPTDRDMPALIAALVQYDQPVSGHYETSYLTPAYVHVSPDAAHLSGIFTVDDLRIIVMRIDAERLAKARHKMVDELVACWGLLRRNGIDRPLEEQIK